MALVRGTAVRFTGRCNGGWWFGPHTHWKMGIIREVRGLSFIIEPYNERTGLIAVDPTGGIPADCIMEIPFLDLQEYVNAGRREDRHLRAHVAVPPAPVVPADNRLPYDIFLVLYGDRDFPLKYVGGTAENATRKVLQLRREGFDILAHKKLTVHY